MTRDEMLSRISAAELVDWAAYERIAGPLGPARSDIQAGIVASTIANVMRTRRGRTYKPKDFIPQWDRPRARTPEAMRDVMISITRQLGGKVITREDAA